ncbi:MAG: flavin reductase family protein [Planctomycetes bacterium]|nr:flavin reductase family protein [Planctomycetota bacterium]
MTIHEVGDRRAMGYLATKPTIIVTTLHASGVVNAGVFGAYTNLSPEHVGIAVHKESHTYANILRAGQFTVNVPGADLVKAIRVLADDIPPERSELDEAGLTVRPGQQIATPSIAECVAAVEFRFDREVPVAGHSFMIGRCVGGWIREDCLDDDGKINIFAARVFKDFKYPKPLYVLPGEVIEG